MARRQRPIKPSTPAAESSSPTTLVPALDMTGPPSSGLIPETTGRYVIVFKDDVVADAAAIRSVLSNSAGIRNVARSSDYKESAVSAETFSESDAVHFNTLGIAIVSGEAAVRSLAASASDVDSPILAIEPEYIARLSNPAPGGLSIEYLRGYRDAINTLYDEAVAGDLGQGGEAGASADLQDTPQFTWGLQATAAATSRYTGQGIKVAVLDTGLDLQHPDFLGRAVVSKSFTGFPVQDIHGHGTHCIGTACGPQRPATGVRRYGIAFGAQIFAGKVFNHDPRPGAPTGSVIEAIEWAVTNGCRVVSLSLGSAIDQKIMQYELPIQRALNAGTLVVAAAGNNANRPGLSGFDPERPSTFGFVEPPANADAAMAVAAIDSRLRIASFSARSSSFTGVGGIVNIAGPGFSVFSSVPVARGGHDFFNGTSMATPHVAGIAALWAEATGLSGMALWNKLLQTVGPLGIASLDAGAGLARAPQ